MRRQRSHASVARGDDASALEVRALRLGDILGMSHGPVRTRAHRPAQKKLQDGHANQAQRSLRGREHSTGESSSIIVISGSILCTGAMNYQNTNVAQRTHRACFPFYWRKQFRCSTTQEEVEHPRLRPFQALPWGSTVLPGGQRRARTRDAPPPASELEPKFL